MASNDELRLTLEGAGGHAAMRAEHRDTVSAAAQLILHLTALNTPERVVSIGKVEAAGATNVIPDRVYMEGTMRTFDERERAEVKRTIEELAAANDASYGVRTRVHFTPGYPCVVNDPELIRQAVALAETEGIPFQMLPLRMTSEDFGFYGTRYRQSSTAWASVPEPENCIHPPSTPTRRPFRPASGSWNSSPVTISTDE